MKREEINKIKEEGIKKALKETINSKLFKIKIAVEEAQKDFLKKIIENLNIIDEELTNVEQLVAELELHKELPKGKLEKV